MVFEEDIHSANLTRELVQVRDGYLRFANRHMHMFISAQAHYILIGSVRSGYPIEGAAALGFRQRNQTKRRPIGLYTLEHPMPWHILTSFWRSHITG